MDLKRALVLAPNEPTLLNYLGYSWVDQNRNIPEALAMLEKAHTLKPTDGYIADSVGWAYYKLGAMATRRRRWRRRSSWCRAIRRSTTTWATPTGA